MTNLSLNISTKETSNHQMHAVKSSFNDDGTAPPIVATNIKPETHTAFRWISANIPDLQ